LREWIGNYTEADCATEQRGLPIGSTWCHILLPAGCHCNFGDAGEAGANLFGMKTAKSRNPNEISEFQEDMECSSAQS
jgi:hypothetical protein